MAYSDSMGKLVDQFLSTPIPAEVWHYTNFAGFEGILVSERVWATEAHFTTDKSEFVHAREVAQNFLERIEPEDEDIARSKQAALATLSHAFDSGPLSTSKTDIFVSSFCAADDLKSQWIEYGNAGKGVSLAFDLSQIRPPEGFGIGVTFAPCLYQTEDKEQMLEDALSDWMETVLDLHRKARSKAWAAERLRDWTLVDRIYGIPFDKQALVKQDDAEFHHRLHAALTRTSFDLLRIASHCKDQGFQQEAEWRLALPHTKGKPMTNMEILHRGTNNAIPYIAHNLFCERLPITRVKVGPLVEDIAPVEALLKQHGYDVQVTKSVIPLRGVESIRA
ncbi:MAG: DUF2971 domain-containing protein [Terracidiphilus sp.]